MSAFGAELTVVPSENGQITPDLFVRMEQETIRIAEREGAYWTRQFHNTDALAGYAELGREVLAQVAADGGSVDAFCAAVGTAGMLAGVSRALRAGGFSGPVIALEPASSPVLTTGKTGPHRVEGIGTGIVPPLLTGDVYDKARAVEERDARQMAVRLAREEGVFAGTSSGLNVAAAIAVARELGPGRTVVTVAADTGLKYLAGDLFGN